MTIQNLRKTAIIAMLVFIVIGLVFFRKENSGGSRTNKNPVPTSSPEKPVLDKAETERIVALAKNFSIIYYSYTLNDFSNIESLYPFMTEKMKFDEKQRVKEAKSKLDVSQKKFTSTRSAPQSFRIESADGDNVTVLLTLNIENVSGAITKKDPIVWVDENGKEFNGNPDNLITSRKTESARISIVKEGGDWKVDKASLTSEN